MLENWDLKEYRASVSWNSKHGHSATYTSQLWTVHTLEIRPATNHHGEVTHFGNDIDYSKHLIMTNMWTILEAMQGLKNKTYLTPPSSIQVNRGFQNILTAGVGEGVEAGVEEAPPVLVLDITEISSWRDFIAKANHNTQNQRFSRGWNHVFGTIV